MILRYDTQITCNKVLRTFAPIAIAHRYSARKFTCHVMHQTRAHDPYFAFQQQILFTMIYTLSKNQQKLSVGTQKNFKISVYGTSNPTILRLQGARNYGR